MNLTDRFRAFAARNTLKIMRITLVPEWARVQFLSPTFRALCTEGVRANGIVFACISELAFNYPEPVLKVYKKGSGGLQEVPNHPCAALLAQPNPQMGMAEMLQHTITYKAIGGNCYWYKVRSAAKRVVEMWPLNDSQIVPIAGGKRLVDHYDWYDEDTGKTERLPAEDFVQFKWIPDPLAPWRGLAPLVAVAREVDTDNEARRYVFTLLKNDAIPRLAMVLPAGAKPLSDDQFKRLQTQWEEKHGGDKRGGMALLEGGADVKRIGLDLQELAFEALSRVPEARICAAFRVPATVAGMNVGLDRAIDANVQGLRRQFAQQTLKPMWRLDADELTSGLLRLEYGEDESMVIGFDTSEVASLQEDQAALRAWANDALGKGGITLNNYRQYIGLPEDPAGDYYLRHPLLSPVPFGEQPAPPVPALPPGPAVALLPSRTPSGAQPTGQESQQPAQTADTGAAKGDQPGSYHPFVSVKFNPHHDPGTGRFTEGGMSDAEVRAAIIDVKLKTASKRNATPAQKTEMRAAYGEALKYLGEDSAMLKPAAGVLLNPAKAPTGALAITHRDGTIELYAPCFKGSYSHPAAQAGILVHESVHAASIRTHFGDTKLAETEATTFTISWAKRRLAAEGDAKTKRVLQGFINTEQNYHDRVAAR